MDVNEKIWNEDIRFRDYFRTHPNQIREYSDLKWKIYGKGIDTLLEYSAQKKGYITEVLRRTKS